MLRLKILAVPLFLLLLGPVGAGTARAEGPWKEAGLGVASVLGSAIYSPVKVTYAALGAFAGGVTWVATGGNTDLAQKIWEPSLRGDYVITPQTLGSRGSSSAP